MAICVVTKGIAIKAGSMYAVDRMTTREVASALSLTLSSARKAILESGVTLRSRSEALKMIGWKISARSKNAPHGPMREETKQKISAAFSLREWKFSGVSKKPNGYIEITRGSDKGRPLHRVIMERQIGRALTRDECVHHIDGDRANNDLSNLQLMTRKEHASLHAKENAPKRKRAKNGQLA